MQYAPTWVHEKPGGFHIPAHGHAENAPDFTLPNTDTPKTHPISDPNLRRRTFRGVCFCALHGYMQKPARFWAQTVGVGVFRGVCFCALHGYVQNLAGFIFPHLNTSKTHPVSGANLRRGAFRGVCFCALHGYVQNLTGFIFPHPNAPKTHPVLPSPIRIHSKPARVYTQNSGERYFGAYAFAPYTGT